MEKQTEDKFSFLNKTNGCIVVPAGTDGIIHLNVLVGTPDKDTRKLARFIERVSKSRLGLK